MFSPTNNREHKIALSLYLEGVGLDTIERALGQLPDGFLDWIQNLGSSIDIIHDAAKSKPPQDKKLILDVVEQKIYIGNQKISSKQIHSQSATIDILNILLENIGKEIDNHHLPSSSYTKNKNQMTSKIISPLKKLVKENFGIELPLSCRGHLYDFCIKLEEHEVPIEVIGKNKPRVHYYEGLNSIKKIYEASLSKGKEVLSIKGLHNMDGRLQERLFGEYQEKRRKSQTPIKIIFSNEARDIVLEGNKKSEAELREAKAIDSKIFSMSCDFLIYGKKNVAVIMFTPTDMSAAVIEDTNIHNSLTSVFNLIWATH